MAAPKIEQELNKLEDEKDITVTIARLGGSRRYGAAHSNSDWDVYFIFTQDPVNYATITDYVGRITELDRGPSKGDGGRINFYGWNVDRFGGLIRTSHPDTIEYIQKNPTEYVSPDDNGPLTRLEWEARKNFNTMSLHRKYLSKAGYEWEKYVSGDKEPTNNRQFRVARGVGMAQHLRKDGSMPPVDVNELGGKDTLAPGLRENLNKLTKAKQNGHGNGKSDDIVGKFYKEERDVDMEPTPDRVKSPDEGKIDDFIKSVFQ